MLFFVIFPVVSSINSPIIFFPAFKQLYPVYIEKFFCVHRSFWILYNYMRLFENRFCFKT
jgi:hypothetical protein